MQLPRVAAQVLRSTAMLSAIRRLTWHSSDASQDQMQQTKIWIDIAANLDPDDPWLARDIGMIALAYQDWTTAEVVLTEYSCYRPNDQTVRLFLGDISQVMGKDDAAIFYWRSVPAGAIYVFRAQLAIRAGDLPQAERDANLALQTASPKYELMMQIGEAYAMLAQEYKTAEDMAHEGPACIHAEEAYESAVRLRPEESTIRIAYAKALRQCGRWQEALSQLASVETAAERLSTRAWAAVEIAMTYAEAGNAAAALPYFQEAVELDPQHGGHRILLAHEYAQLGRPEEALHELETVWASTNHAWRAWAYAEAGSIYLTNNELEAARQAFNNALTIQPDRDDWRVLLGLVYLRMGDGTRARILFVQALHSSNPDWRAWAERQMQSLELLPY